MIGQGDKPIVIGQGAKPIVIQVKTTDSLLMVEVKFVVIGKSVQCWKNHVGDWWRQNERSSRVEEKRRRHRGRQTPKHAEVEMHKKEKTGEESEILAGYIHTHKSIEITSLLTGSKV